MDATASPGGLDTAPASAAAAPASTAAEYEFSHSENMVIGQCSHRARIFGILCAISGVIELIAAGATLFALSGGMATAFLLPAGAFNLVLGIYLTRASTNLSLVVTTAGNDVTLMMGALQQLSRAFFVQIIAAVVLMVTILATLAATTALSGILSR